MKTRNQTNRPQIGDVDSGTRTLLQRIGILVVGLLLWPGLVTPLAAMENDKSLDAQISHSQELYHRLSWVGGVPPSNADNEALWAIIDKMPNGKTEENIAALEKFVDTFTNSPWVPSIQANLGRYCREHGQYTKALAYWETAWNATKQATNGPAKNVADYTFAYWTKLLASLGRVDTLAILFKETRNRTFDGGPLQQIINGTKEGYATMLSNPGICFKCGTFALENVARKLKGPTFNWQEIDKIPSPMSGFSLSRLVELSDSHDLDLVAVDWANDRELVVPSVVHWKQAHYAAILEEKNGRYLVVDPTFGRQCWLKLSDIENELTGQFLVPRSKLPKHWKLLAEAETDAIYGKGYDTGIDDGTDGCGNGSGGSNGGGGGGGGGNPGISGGATQGVSGGGGGSGSIPDRATRSGGLCSSGGCGDGPGDGPGGGGTRPTPPSPPTCNQTCPVSQGGNSGGNGDPSSPGNPGLSGGGMTQGAVTGMPIWKVSEPYINVWLYDSPLGYRPGLGMPVTFTIAYKQREKRPVDVPFSNLGPMWDCSWLSYIIDDTNNNLAIIVLPDGGEQVVTPDNTTHEYFSHSLVQRNTNGSGNLTGFVVSYANGGKDYYQYVTNVTLDMKHLAFLTAKTDPFGHSIQFQYQRTTDGVLLKYIVDMDGRTNTVSYANGSFPLQITSVQDPFGRTATLQYSSGGILTNVTDVAGLSSGFKFDSQGWVTNLITPYGTTTFQYTNNPLANIGLNGEFNYFGQYPQSLSYIRAVTVVDPLGGTNVYMLKQDSGRLYTNETDYLAQNSNFIEFVPYSGLPDSVLPANFTPSIGAYSGYTFSPQDNDIMNYRNSFHWGPRQASTIPPDLFTLTPGDYVKARMRHWFHVLSGAPDPGYIGQSLCMEQSPSPDGINPGQTTWYDYKDRTTFSQPLWVGQRLPDGQTYSMLYARDEWGRPTNVVETYSAKYGDTPSERSYSYIYNSGGANLNQVIGPNGEVLAGYGYDGANQLIRYTNAAGDITTNFYDAQGRLSGELLSTGLTVTNLYFASGPNTNWVQTRIEKEIYRTNTFSYTNDLVYIRTNELGLITTNLYDALQRLTNSSDPRGAIAYFYSNLDLVKIIDRMGFSNSFAYDANRRLVASTNAVTNYTHYNYCSCGSLDSIEDALGHFTYFYYNNAGWLTNAVYTNVFSITNFYSLLGQVTNVIDSGGNSVTNWYNNQGLPYAVSNYFGQVKLLAFDMEDRVTNSVDANGVVITNLYDNAGRLLTQTYLGAGTNQFAYSARGLIIHTNQLGFTNLIVYDEAGRKIAETNANNEGTHYTYDPAGNLLTLTDGKNQTTTWTYTIYGLTSNKVDATSTVILKYRYDADNRLTNRWSAEKLDTYYSYDRVGNLTNITYHSNPPISLAYDALNRMTNMVDGVGTNKYTYDAVGQLLSEDGPWPDDTVSYTYTSRLRNSMSLQQTDADAWVQTYAYDGAKRMTSTTSPAGGFGYTYDGTAKMLVKKLSLPNSAYITNDYDGNARLLDTWLKNSGNTNLNSHSYSYNTGNQRTSQTRTAGDYVDYLYDKIGQLTNAAGKEPVGGTNRIHERFAYGYDAAHNLNARTNNALVDNFVVNNLNGLSNITHSGTLTVEGATGAPATSVMVNSSSATLFVDNTFAEAGFTVTNGNNTFTAIASDTLGRSSTNTVSVNFAATTSYSYDTNGNLLSDGTRGFDYDDENQLIRVTVTDTWKSEFTYDGKMRRRIRKEFTWQSSAWLQTNEVRYVYDGNVVIQERDQFNLPTVTYTRGTDLSGSLQGAGGIGGLLARTDQSSINSSLSTSFYHADGNGNVTALINSPQFIVAKYLYDPFGNILSQSGSSAEINLYRFSSKEYNANSGLIYYLYRFYDPNLQRWSNRDPYSDYSSLAFLPLDTKSRRFTTLEVTLFLSQSPFEAIGGANLNVFIYNSPIDYVDSWGLDCWSDWENCLTPSAACSAAFGGPTGLIGGAFGGYLGAGPHTGPKGFPRPIVRAGKFTGYGRGIFKSIGGGYLGGALVGVAGLEAKCYGALLGCLSVSPTSDPGPPPYRPPYSGGPVNTLPTLN